jgi:hypothetical protein
MDIIQAFQMYWQQEGLEGVLMGRRAVAGRRQRMTALGVRRAAAL